jgi:hypothetical protein
MRLFVLVIVLSSKINNFFAARSRAYGDRACPALRMGVPRPGFAGRPPGGVSLWHRLLFSESVFGTKKRPRKS